MRKHSLAVVAWAGLVQGALAANVIQVSGGTQGTDFTIDTANAKVELLNHGTYTIWADNDTTTGDLADGYINAVILGSGAGTGDFEVRIARLISGTMYGPGAQYVGWVKPSDGGARRGFLGTVHIKGQFGVKIVNGQLVAVDPSAGEVTELFQANGLGESSSRFQIDTNTFDADSGSVAQNAQITVGVGNGSSASVGWNLKTVLARDWKGTLQTQGLSDISGGTTDHRIEIGRDMSGVMKCKDAIDSTIFIKRDMSGSIIANEDGDNGPANAAGDLNRALAVGRNFTGAIKALTTQGNGGMFNGKVDIGGGFSGTQAQPALILSQGGLGTNSWVRLNYDGAVPGTWDSSHATVQLGSTVYSGHNESARVYYISSTQIGDLNFDGLVNNFDIDPFTARLTGCDNYLLLFPAWLDCASTKHADAGGGQPCTPDGKVNNFDIDCFVEVLTQGGGRDAQASDPPAEPGACCQ